MSRSHKYRFRRAILILLIFVGLAALHLFINTQNISLKYKLTDLKLTLNELKTKNRLLAIDVARKENLNLIEKSAKEKLKMSYPDKISYLVVSKEAKAKADTAKMNPR